ncbi:tRNA uracil 4-sulfurtransferase ThiI [Sporosalibacterium faouarense]|uniref:tRNA uracil 4-sulfurtransferase ThiI n=1 Tax=Sporosalibacterium faouarense TaxID=516123 RepID=UPI00141D0324|nr:tRNA uracil 4-sulfurtransferase ThiI [Sporosalibacterium faouarense]MTI49240.1 tRNA 4-thiouridine(8) synthase ThiI [Bacillota bacterium]
MDKVVSVSFGELALKGLNRSYFENKLVKHVRRVVRDFGEPKVYKEQGKLYIEAEEFNIDEIVNTVKKVFGIVLVSPCYRIEKDLDEITKYSIEAVKEAMSKRDIKTFKVQCKRADKQFPMNSMEVARKLGHEILKEVDGLSVDVHKPDLYVYVDIRTNAYIFTEKISAYGGLPVGTNGKGLLLLSGGIDSPVAGFMMAKRGLQISAVHYHSYPFTSERAEEKVKKLAEILSVYCGSFRFYSVNLLDIQKAINENCPEKEMTLLSRRFMMKIAEKIAVKEEIDALITGESMGQVASQTIKSLNVTNSAVDVPIFRPLIGMDKTEITDIATEIETFETSILPYEDCCTVFLPKHPVTRPKLEDIERSESVLDVDKLVNEAIEKMEVITIHP